jgi:hypothetical protein
VREIGTGLIEKRKGGIGVDIAKMTIQRLRGKVSDTGNENMLVACRELGV